MRNLLIFIFSMLVIVIYGQQNPVDIGVSGGGKAPDTLRNVYWVHGLGGKANTSWTRVGDHLEAQLYKMKSFYPGYSQTTIPAAASTLLNELMTYPVNPDASPPIAIGHSQGGLVIRAAEQRAVVGLGGQPVPFGGIVTFGTPHGGAPIIANIPEILNYLQEGCDVMVDARIEELIETHFLLDIFLDADDILNDFGLPLCEFIAQTGAPNLLAKFLATSTEDYAPEAKFLDSLNNFPSTLNKVAFYGEEEDPVFYRTAAWLNKSPESVSTYSANEDEELIDIVDSLRQNMIDKSDHYGKLASDIKYWLKFNAGYLGLGIIGAKIKFEIDAKENRTIRNKYKKASNWLGNIDEMWKKLIGVATDMSSTTKAYCECFEEDLHGNIIGADIHEVPIGSDCSQYFNPLTDCDYIEQQHFEFMEFEESDGIVPVSSGKAFPGATIGQVMLGSNHQQMRNDVNTQFALEDQLFTGSLNPFFMTPVK